MTTEQLHEPVINAMERALTTFMQVMQSVQSTAVGEKNKRKINMKTLHREQKTVCVKRSTEWNS